MVCISVFVDCISVVEIIISVPSTPFSIPLHKTEKENMILYYCRTYLFIHTLEFIDSVEYFTAPRDIMVSKEDLHVYTCVWVCLTCKAIGADTFENYKHKY